MLEGLDQIDWTQYSHRIGVSSPSATEIPALLRSLLDEDEEISDEEHEETVALLLGEGQDFGAITEATIHFVPFLFELMAFEEFRQTPYLFQYFVILKQNERVTNFSDEYHQRRKAILGLVAEQQRLFLSLLQHPNPQTRGEVLNILDGYDMTMTDLFES